MKFWIPDGRKEHKEDSGEKKNRVDQSVFESTVKCWIQETGHKVEDENSEMKTKGNSESGGIWFPIKVLDSRKKLQNKRITRRSRKDEGKF